VVLMPQMPARSPRQSHHRSVRATPADPSSRS